MKDDNLVYYANLKLALNYPIQKNMETKNINGQLHATKLPGNQHGGHYICPNLL